MGGGAGQGSGRFHLPGRAHGGGDKRGGGKEDVRGIFYPEALAHPSVVQQVRLVHALPGKRNEAPGGYGLGFGFDTCLVA